MKNKYLFREKLIKYRAVGLLSGSPIDCATIKCSDCDFSAKGTSCDEFYKEWLEKEATCRFKHDEVIEVSSYNKEPWFKRHFKEYDGDFYRTYESGRSSLTSETAQSEYWKFARSLEEDK